MDTYAENRESAFTELGLVAGEFGGALFEGGGLLYNSIFKGAEIAESGVNVAVEQYSLRALESGFYPVMGRGFANARELTWLEKGEVWKFGTTKNPLTRYSQTWLKDINLRYVTEFEGTSSEVLKLERMKIMNFIDQTGILPAGNKIIK